MANKTIDENLELLQSTKASIKDAIEKTFDIEAGEGYAKYPEFIEWLGKKGEIKDLYVQDLPTDPLSRHRIYYNKTNQIKYLKFHFPANSIKVEDGKIVGYNLVALRQMSHVSVLTNAFDSSIKYYRFSYYTGGWGSYLLNPYKADVTTDNDVRVKVPPRAAMLFKIYSGSEITISEISKIEYDTMEPTDADDADDLDILNTIAQPPYTRIYCYICDDYYKPTSTTYAKQHRILLRIVGGDNGAWNEYISPGAIGYLVPKFVKVKDGKVVIDTTQFEDMPFERFNIHENYASHLNLVKLGMFAYDEETKLLTLDATKFLNYFDVDDEGNITTKITTVYTKEEETEEENTEG